MPWLRTLVLVCTVAVIGCGDPSQDVDPPDTTAKESVKAALENIAETGGGGSEIGAAMQELKNLEESDPQLADELGEGMGELMSTQMSADQRKQKAKELISKLDGASGG